MTSRWLGRGGGTSLPGMVARRVHPRVLAELVGRRQVPAVAITGSNGKTTTARFLAALLRGEGIPTALNPAGSNLIQGVTSLAVSVADLRGRMPAGVLAVEVDEGALRLVVPEISPRALVVTNLFRDQLDRFGEIYAVAEAIESVAAGLPQDVALVVNSDDPMVADMAHARRGRRITFGLELAGSTDRLTSAADTIRCPRCRTDLVYERVYLSHLGRYRCDACGFARPRPDVAVTAIERHGLEETRCTVTTAGETIEISIPQAGLHVAYNAAAAVAACVALGVAVPHATRSLARVAPAFGRLEVIQAGSQEIVLAFAKNPTSFNTTLRTLDDAGEPQHLLVAVSNTLVDGEDFGWLWDVDFGGVAGRVQRVTVSGLRRDEMATRLKYAGVDPRLMTLVEDRRAALDTALAGVPDGGRLVAVASYTPTIELRDEMRRRGWVDRYWKS